MTDIHPTAAVDPQAQIGEGVRVGPFAYIGPDVKIGAGTIIHNHASICGCTTIGTHAQVHASAVVGGPPQDLKYKGGRTTLTIGDFTVIRECATLNTGTELGGGRTVVGNHNLIMAYAHIAHDCVLEDRVVVANAAQLAGHVHIEAGARISGLAAIHHFVRIGQGGFVAGCARLSIDVPPYTLAEGFPARIRGLNLEGLRRQNVDDETVMALKEVYRMLFRKEDLTHEQAYEEIKKRGLDKHALVDEFICFVQDTDRGRHGRAQEGTRVKISPEDRDGPLGLRAESIPSELAQ